MNNQYSSEKPDLDVDFNVEEIEHVIAPDVDDSGYNSITTSVFLVCCCRAMG
jgi:hypothetical protein